MIAVTSNEGQMCNRLWSYLFLTARSFHLNEHIFILDFQAYIHLFENLSRYSKVHFVESEIIKTIIRKASGLNLRLINRAKSDSSPKSILTIVKGWNYKFETMYLSEYRRELLELFKPRVDAVEKCNALLLPFKRDHILIGVHIRRTDYNSFFNGIFYYENETYKKFIGQAFQLFTEMNTGKEVCFLLCSDEKTDPDDFTPYPCIHIPDANSIEDLYGLSICDYIIGPPSTYSWWASFYGNVPLYMIVSKNGILTRDQFKVCVSFGTFQEGSR